MSYFSECPECGSKELTFDEVDIGVGIQTGNYGCQICGWLEPWWEGDTDD